GSVVPPARGRRVAQGRALRTPPRGGGRVRDPPGPGRRDRRPPVPPAGVPPRARTHAPPRGRRPPVRRRDGGIGSLRADRPPDAGRVLEPRRRRVLQRRLPAVAALR